jgi:hypothetical protein
MKRAALLAISVFAFAAILPAQISQRLQGGLIDAYVASYTMQEPNIPGMEPAANFVAVSFSSSDPYVEAFIIVMRVQLEDGTIAPVCQIVGRASTGGNTVVRFAVPGKPVKIDKLYIERYHAEPRDVLVK